MGDKVLGIDPGAGGGLAVVDIDGGPLVHGMRMPTLRVSAKQTVTDPVPVRQLITRHAPYRCVVVEQVGAMPKQGVTSAFNFGASYGSLLSSVLGALPDTPLELVTPAVWKRSMGLLKQGKAASLDAARMRYGDDPLWRVKANDGIAEAALLAAYWIDKRSGR